MRVKCEACGTEYLVNQGALQGKKRGQGTCCCGESITVDLNHLPRSRPVAAAPTPALSGWTYSFLCPWFKLSLSARAGLLFVLTILSGVVLLGLADAGLERLLRMQEHAVLEASRAQNPAPWLSRCLAYRVRAAA